LLRTPLRVCGDPSLAPAAVLLQMKLPASLLGPYSHICLRRLGGVAAAVCAAAAACACAAICAPQAAAAAGVITPCTFRRRG